MWKYERRLQYPLKIKAPDGNAAKLIISQFGGPDGELGASQRYLSQRYAMPYTEVATLLTDIGTEELAHMEMVCAMVQMLTKNLTTDEIEKAGLAPYFVDHTLGIWPQSAGGVPWSATTFQSKGDPITDLTENMAAEQKARTTYDNILRLVDNPDVKDAIRFLREREVVHFQRFGDAKHTHSNRFIYKVHNQKKGLSKHGSPFGFYSSPLYSSLFINFIHLFCHLAIIATV